MKKKWTIGCMLCFFALFCVGFLVKQDVQSVFAEQVRKVEDSFLQESVEREALIEKEEVSEKEAEEEHVEERVEEEVVVKEEAGDQLTKEEREEPQNSVEETLTDVPGTSEEEKLEQQEMEDVPQVPEQSDPTEEPESTQGEFEETKSDFSIRLKAESEEKKAGEKLIYEVLLNNTGEEDLLELKLQSFFSREDIQVIWEKNEKLSKGEEGVILIDSLKKGETLRLHLQIKIPEDMKNPLEYSITATTKDAKNEKMELRRDAQICTTIVPLTIAYEVEKNADCSAAHPGDVVTYTIVIRNTGERTLHSIITTEHFVQEGVQAFFIPQQGILFSMDRTKAYIAQLNAGEEAVLKASVVIPDTAVDQELINQVYVTTKETGTEQQQSEATVQIKQKEAEVSQTPTLSPAEEISEVQENASDAQKREAVQTGDGTNISRWIRLSAAALLLIVLVVFARKARK